MEEIEFPETFKTKKRAMCSYIINWVKTTKEGFADAKESNIMVVKFENMGKNNKNEYYLADSSYYEEDE